MALTPTPSSPPCACTQVFDEVRPEKDPSIIAAFLNSKLLGGVLGRKGTNAPAQAPGRLEMQVVPVEVPAGIKRSTLRDAMLQWRLRHTAHPIEGEAVDWLLSQLEPVDFGLSAIKVPEQLRLLLVEALLTHAQKHAELQLDAAHAVRLQCTLQQLHTRFTGLELSLPDDENGTKLVRELVNQALQARLSQPSGRSASLEEGMLLQQAMHALGPALSLVALNHTQSDGKRGAGH